MQEYSTISIVDDTPIISKDLVPISLFDIVQVLDPLPQLPLIGTVVEILGEDAYLVECSDEKGATSLLMGFRREQLKPLDNFSKAA